MDKYFVILPHAGAIRNSYSHIESIVSNEYRVIFIEYSSIEKNENCFDFNDLIKGVKKSIDSAIINKNAEIVFLGHSMGSMILQYLENVLYREYYIEKFIYSDSINILEIECEHLNNKEDWELNALIDDVYDIPENIKENRELSNYFQDKLMKDLLIIDTLHKCKDSYVYDSSIPNKLRKFICSEYIPSKDFTDSWSKLMGNIDDENMTFISGNHYSILKKFDMNYIN